jgi:ABC-type uncharacterized transport system permease subunit
MEENKGFVKCELKFILLLILGISLLNIVGILFQYTFISIVISAIMFCFYILYFIFGIVKYSIFKKDYECVDIRKRVNSWLSSLI